MHAYRVTGKGFQVGAGALILLVAAAAAERSHKVIVEKQGDVKQTDGFTLVTAKEPQAFKVGEVIGLVDAPKGQMHLVELVGEHDASEPGASMRKAIVDHDKAVKAAERAAARAREEEEKRKEAERLANDGSAAEKRWTEEWQSTEAARKQYPKVADYIAAKKREAAKASA